MTYLKWLHLFPWPNQEQSSDNTTHRDTTILSSLDFCYTFLHKRNYQVVVSAEKETSVFIKHLPSILFVELICCLRCHCRFLTFSLQLDNMLIMLRQTDCTERAGDQSSVRIDRQMWPLLYTWGWTGIFSPVNITCVSETKTNTLLSVSYSPSGV